MPDETWAPVPGFDKYQVSDLGRVYSIARAQVLRGRLNRGGYPRVSLSLGRRSLSRTYAVHTLVMAAFVGPRPAGMQVAHRDGDRLNACLANLRYATPKENTADRYLHGTVAFGDQVGTSKLTAEQALEIFHRSSRESSADLGREFGVHRATVDAIKAGRNWSWLTAPFREAQA